MGETQRTALAEKVRAAPQQPGCYLFTDRYGYIIYVGKAKNLRSRVKSYFTKAAAEDERTAELVPTIGDVEYQVTGSELDALLLEYRLIKQHKPWFNAQMKPDKRRPYLRIAAGTPYATLSVSDAPGNDGATYYDFFTDEDDVKQALALLGRVWGLPQCGQRSFAGSRGPCLYHTLTGCMAPCSREPDEHQYAAVLAEVQLLFAGGRVPRVKVLKQEMAEAAAALAFERAAACKELLEGLQRLQHKSRRWFHLPEQGAALVLIRPHREKAFSVFSVVDGQVRRRADFPPAPDETSITAFAAAVAAADAAPPTTGAVLEDSEWLAGCLTEVVADKQFVLLPDGKGAGRVAERAIKKFIK